MRIFLQQKKIMNFLKIFCAVFHSLEKKVDPSPKKIIRTNTVNELNATFEKFSFEFFQ